MHAHGGRLSSAGKLLRICRTDKLAAPTSDLIGCRMCNFLAAVSSDAARLLSSRVCFVICGTLRLRYSEECKFSRAVGRLNVSLEALCFRGRSSTLGIAFRSHFIACVGG